jgi:hypothetical protein
MSKTELDAIDRDALERSIAVCRAESPARAKQIDSMLQDTPWERVGVFAASCAQSRSLDLMPWQSLPFRASRADLDKPFDDPRGEREAAEVKKKLLVLGLSAFEPDPLAAIEQAETGAKRA